MKKLLVLLVILQIALTAEVKGTFWTNRLSAYTEGKHTCFDKRNGQILDARLAIFHDVFFPVNNSMFSNMYKKINYQQRIILDLEKDKKKKKWYIIGGGALGIVLGTLTTKILLQIDI